MLGLLQSANGGGCHSKLSYCFAIYLQLKIFHMFLFMYLYELSYNTSCLQLHFFFGEDKLSAGEYLRENKLFSIVGL